MKKNWGHLDDDLTGPEIYQRIMSGRAGYEPINTMTAPDVSIQCACRAAHARCVCVWGVAPQGEKMAQQGRIDELVTELMRAYEGIQSAKETASDSHSAIKFKEVGPVGIDQ